VAIDAAVVITFSEPIAAGTFAYTITITAADDLAGNPLAGAPYAWSLSTSRHRVYLPLVAREYP
jgi:hypothetical protein